MLIKEKYDLNILYFMYNNVQIMFTNLHSVMIWFAFLINQKC